MFPTNHVKSGLYSDLQNLSAFEISLIPLSSTFQMLLGLLILHEYSDSLY